MFKIGQKVICINDNFDISRAVECKEVNPIRGKIYTVRGLRDDTIKLVEIINPIQQYTKGIMEKSFKTFRFKEVDYSFAEGILEEISKAVNEEAKLN